MKIQFSMPSCNTSFRVCIVLPIYNEEAILEKSVQLLHDYCSSALQEIKWTIIIADNGSQDTSAEIGQQIASIFANVFYIRRASPGKGGSIAQAWSLHDENVYVYMDCDLATDLKHLSEIIDAIRNENYDIAIGSRLIKGASTSRSLLREICSRLNSMLPRFFFPSFPIFDCPCGFKAISHRIKKEMLPSITDTQWFFDTELLIKSHAAGYRIAEIPIAWRDQRYAVRKSKVNLLLTGLYNIKKLFELRSVQKKLPKSIFHEGPADRDGGRKSDF